jgi:hypothetical protein
VYALRSLILFLLFATGVNDTSGTGGKFTTGVFDTGVVDTGKKFAASVVDSGGKFANSREKNEITLLLFSGAWGKMIHEKNLPKKSRDNVPLKFKSIFKHIMYRLVLEIIFNT